MVTVVTQEQFDVLNNKVDQILIFLESRTKVVDNRFDKLHEEILTLTGHVLDVQEDVKEIRTHLGI
jgi:hypothetical protein